MLHRSHTTARLVTAFFLREDRNAILEELTWLHQVHEQEPKLHLVPGHDGPVIDELVKQGVLTKGFVL